MRSTNILGVVRTNAAASAIGPLFAELNSRGHRTVLCAESGGQATYRLTEPHREISNQSELLEMFAEKFDLVVTGLSADGALEKTAGVEAKRRNIPLVHIEDFWGGHLFATAEPDLLLVIDAMAKQMARLALPQTRTAIVGLPGLFLVTPNQKLQQELDSWRTKTGARFVVYTDTGQEAMETLPVLVESIRQTSTPLTLIPKWNPNTAELKSDDGRTWRERCEEIILPLRNDKKVLDVAASTDEVVMSADMTASGFSVLLFRALYAGKVALTLWTPLIKQLLKEKTGLTETPLMMRGCPFLQESKPLDALLQERPKHIDSEPFDPRAAAEAVLSLILV